MSNEAKHTPLPWAAVRQYGSAHWMIGYGEYGLIANVGNHAPDARGRPNSANGAPEGEIAANAALIVRAVNAHADLLATLEMAKATIERLEVKHAGGFSSCSGTLDVIRAALAKARGEAQ